MRKRERERKSEKERKRERERKSEERKREREREREISGLPTTMSEVVPVYPCMGTAWSNGLLCKDDI